MDVSELLGAVASDAPSPAPSTVLADLDRGRAALTRRRRRRATAGAALGVACVMGLTGLLQTSRDGDRTIGPASPAVSLEPTASPSPTRMAAPFVPYTGPQSDVVRIGSIPAGWVSEGFDGTELRLVPPGVAADWDEAIRVIPMGPEAEPLPGAVPLVDGRPTTLEGLPDGGYQLTIDYPLVTVVIEFPADDGPVWSEQEMLDFAEGIEVG